MLDPRLLIQLVEIRPSERKLRYKISKTHVACFAVALATQVAAKQTTSQLVDRMVIHLKPGLLQQIEVRAKSFGPGFCEVRVTFLDKQVVIVGPPLTWSTWTKVGPAVTGGSRNVGFTPKCDTDALGEVRYEAQDQ